LAIGAGSVPTESDLGIDFGGCSVHVLALVGGSGGMNADRPFGIGEEEMFAAVLLRVPRQYKDAKVVKQGVGGCRDRVGLT
jgi:hypothetical protein